MATREQTLRSYELFARYVMPRFQGSLETIRGSNEWARGNRRPSSGRTSKRSVARTPTPGREAPAEFKQRTSGAREE